MKKFTTAGLIILLTVFLVPVHAAWLQGKTKKSFPAKQRVDIKTVSGNCIIKTGSMDRITIEIEADVDPSDAFEPEFHEGADRLMVKEHWVGQHSSGYVQWTITVPKQTEINYSTASGDISVTGIEKDVKIESASGDIEIRKAKGDFDIRTASGEIQLRNMEGDFAISAASGDIKASEISGTVEMGTASGDIDLSDSKGSFEIKCASGDIDAKNLEMESESEMKTASGSIKVILSQTVKHDLRLSTASGNILLDYNGHPLKGRFELISRKNAGQIQAPGKFDNEEMFERHGREYVRKTLTREGETPRITLETASGNINLKK